MGDKAGIGGRPLTHASAQQDPPEGSRPPPVLASRISRSCPSIADDSMTILWAPESNSNIIADLCFVHGLGGHPHGTWTYGKKSTARPSDHFSSEGKPKKPWSLSTGITRLSLKKGRSLDSEDMKRGDANDHASAAVAETDASCFWPFDLVPDDFDNIRVLTYGYDSHPSHFYRGRTNQMTITQHAQQLLQQVTNARTECRGRPIIFVAHSLGGILVKDMIIQSGKYQYQPKLLDVSSCVLAIIFFGTPHLGANAATYGEMVSSVVGSLPGGLSVYKEVLRGLKPDGEKLSNVNADFNDILNKNVPAREKIQIYSFQEGKPLSSVKLFDGKIVPDTSSFFNRRDVEQISFISENHMNMCRFGSARAAGYVDFRAALKGYLDEIDTKDASNFVGSKTNSDQLRVAEHEALELCFDFKERLVRQQQVESFVTIEETFDWLWTSPFYDWLQSVSPLFWISGSPASGKSTMMSHIRWNSKTLDVLKQSNGSDWKLMYHFFDFRAGDSIGNNFEGLLRSFLVQLLAKNPGLLSRAPDLKDFVANEKFTKESAGVINQKGEQMKLKNPVIAIPSINAMYRALKQAFGVCSTRILILLDGLDEYEGQKIELVNMIKSLGSGNVRFCLASRADPPFPDAFDGVPSFEMQKLNTPGIKAFATLTLQDFSSHFKSHDDTELQSVADDVAQRSRGVFLWARFAIFELIDGLTRGEALGSVALRRRLEQVPRELQDIYSRIFRRGTPGDRETAGLVLLLISKALTSRLTITKLHEALDLLPKTLDAFQHSILGSFDKSVMTDAYLQRAMLAATGGTLETFKTDDGGPEDESICIRLSHRTVESYLDLRGWQEIFGGDFSQGLGHELWLRICANTVLLARSKAKQRSSARRRKSGIHMDRQGDPILLTYALKALPFHAAGYEGDPQKTSFPLISSALSEKFVSDHQMATQGGGGDADEGDCQWCCRGLPKGCVHKPIHLAIAHGWVRYIEDYLCEKGGRVDRNLVETAVACACREPILLRTTKSPQCNQILEILLKDDALVEDIDIMMALTRRASLATVQTLLQYRGPGKLRLISSKNSKEGSQTEEFWKKGEQYTSLGLLGARGSSDAEAEAIIDFLLERGEDINESCENVGTILHCNFQTALHSEYEYDDSFVPMLLPKGLDVNRSGPRGNALEYLWQILHEEADEVCMDEEDIHRIICQMIDLGCVNLRQDPNGLVPSKDRMRNFYFRKGEGEPLMYQYGDRYKAWKKERLRYYRKGPLPSKAQ